MFQKLVKSFYAINFDLIILEPILKFSNTLYNYAAINTWRYQHEARPERSFSCPLVTRDFKRWINRKIERIYWRRLARDKRLEGRPLLCRCWHASKKFSRGRIISDSGDKIRYTIGVREETCSPRVSRSIDFLRMHSPSTLHIGDIIER